jgi:MATE family multidrug resistance protein
MGDSRTKDGAVTFSARAIRQELGPMVRLAAPLVAAELGWMVMGIVDTMMVGRLPESALSIGAVSLGNALFIVAGLFGGGLLLGLDTLVSQAFGAGRVDDCHHSLLNGLYLALGAAPVLMGVVWLSLPVLPMLGIDAAVLRLAVPYLKAVTWSTLPLLFYFAFRRYLQGMNLVAPVAFALLTANAVNVAANWALIFGHLGAPRLGVVGAGWATTVSRVYMAAVLLVYIVRHDRRYGTGLWSVAWRPDAERIRRLVALGLPAATQWLLEVSVFSAATGLVGRLGALPLAAHHIALNTASFMFMVPLGISSAAAVRVGQALGRRDPHGASQAGWTALALGGGFMGCSALAMLTIPQWIARIYTPDATVITAAAGLLLVAAFFQLFDGLQVVSIGALRGVGDTRTPMLTHLVVDWFIGLPVGYYLAFHAGFGAAGLWAGLSVAMILAGSILLLVWNRRMHALAGASTR